MGARVLTTSFFLVSTSVSVHQLLDHLPVQSAKRPFVRDLQGGSMVGVLYGFHKISEATPSNSPPPPQKKAGGGYWAPIWGLWAASPPHCAMVGGSVGQ